MSDYAHPEVLVDSQWLMEHLGDATVRVVEVDMSPEPYQNAHIPGIPPLPIRQNRPMLACGFCIQR